jgi:hypothetical protein
MEEDVVRRKKNVLPFVATWISLKDMQNGVSQE